MKNKYEPFLLEKAKEIDDFIDGQGGIVKLTKGAINDENSAIRELYNIISYIANTDNENLHSEIKKFNDILLKFFGYQKIKNSFTEKEKIEDKEEEYTLSELLQQLNDLVGLEKVKQKVADLIAFQKVQKLRKENHLSTSKNTLHLAFTGNPGTGKTTVARIVGRIYKQLGLLSKGHFVEVSRTDLIAGYQGQTALKVKKVIENAKGGVLFIDEAYSITENEHSDSYGRECLTELTKALEDYREDLVVIVAGYTEPMNKFFEANLGLKSRFNTFIEFDDYNENELFSILNQLFQKNDYILSEEVKIKAKEILSALKRDTNFSNGRFVRNLYEELVMIQAKRVAQIENPTIEDLKIIQAKDIAFFVNNQNL